MLEHIAMSGLWILLAFSSWMLIFILTVATITVAFKPFRSKR
jgi:hypothetical protein